MYDKRYKRGNNTVINNKKEVKNMNTYTVFTLFDKTEHSTINKAKEHCLEMMGAETRDMIQDIYDNRSIYKSALCLVSDEKYDVAILEYIKWRKEYNLLLDYEMVVLNK